MTTPGRVTRWFTAMWSSSRVGIPSFGTRQTIRQTGTGRLMFCLILFCTPYFGGNIRIVCTYVCKIRPRTTSDVSNGCLVFGIWILWELAVCFVFDWGIFVFSWFRVWSMWEVCFFKMSLFVYCVSTLLCVWICVKCNVLKFIV